MSEEATCFQKIPSFTPLTRAWVPAKHAAVLCIHRDSGCTRRRDALCDNRRGLAQSCRPRRSRVSNAPIRTTLKKFNLFFFKNTVRPNNSHQSPLTHCHLSSSQLTACSIDVAKRFNIVKFAKYVEGGMQEIGISSTPTPAPLVLLPHPSHPSWSIISSMPHPVATTYCHPLWSSIRTMHHATRTYKQRSFAHSVCCALSLCVA